MTAFRKLSLRDAPAVEPVEGLHWVPVRRALDVGAFGVNAFRAAAGDPVIEEHEESPGQEELYVVVQGAVRFTIGGESVDAAHGDAVLVPDPTLVRGAVAVEDGTIVLAIGGWREKPYHALPWEPIYLAAGPTRGGEWAQAAEIIEREAGPLRESWPVRYRLAALYARLGDDDRALAELAGAIEANPQAAERAREDEAFAALRNHPRWPDRD